ncbi:MAG: GGDEF domain-containing protein [Bryobacteraceae bacterium]
MISIKKYLDSNHDELLQPALDCYRAALGAMGATGAQACPPVGTTLQQSLANLQQRISAELTPAQVFETEAGVEKELDGWARSATDYYRQCTDQFKELLVVMAATAEAVGERDSRHEEQFHDFSARLSKIAEMHDLPQIRTSLLASAVELKSCVQKMAQEGKEAVAQLRAEVKKCHTRIEEAEQVALVEPLTGLANRRGMEAAIEFRLAQKRRFSLLMLDLNGFKKINDTYGHLAGDQVLKQFAGELKGIFRVTDSVGRWAGDEFVVVLDSAQAEASDYAERVKRWAFGDYTVGGPGEQHKVHVDAAVGVTEWQRGETMPELLGRADRLMYQQKRSR